MIRPPLSGPNPLQADPLLGVWPGAAATQGVADPPQDVLMWPRNRLSRCTDRTLVPNLSCPAFGYGVREFHSAVALVAAHQ